MFSFYRQAVSRFCGSPSWSGETEHSFSTCEQKGCRFCIGTREQPIMAKLAPSRGTLQKRAVAMRHADWLSTDIAAKCSREGELRRDHS